MVIPQQTQPPLMRTVPSASRVAACPSIDCSPVDAPNAPLAGSYTSAVPGHVPPSEGKPITGEHATPSYLPAMSTLPSGMSVAVDQASIPAVILPVLLNAPVAGS